MAITSLNIECEECGQGPYKSKAGLASHQRAKHPKEPVAVEVPAETERTITKELTNEEVIFTSPRSPTLRVVITPVYWVDKVTPGGTIRVMTEGKEAKFEGGFFKTSDPEIINHLENVYNNGRFPIYSQRKLKELL